MVRKPSIFGFPWLFVLGVGEDVGDMYRPALKGDSSRGRPSSGADHVSAAVASHPVALSQPVEGLAVEA